MKQWNKSEAIDAVRELVGKIPDIKKSGRGSSEHTRWLANTLRILEGFF